MVCLVFIEYVFSIENSCIIICFLYQSSQANNS
jgi:hypothetical protein